MVASSRRKGVALTTYNGSMLKGTQQQSSPRAEKPSSKGAPNSYFFSNFSCSTAPLSLARRYSSRASYRALTSSRRRRMSSISECAEAVGSWVALHSIDGLAEPPPSSGTVRIGVRTKLTLDVLAPLSCPIPIGKLGIGGGARRPVPPVPPVPLVPVLLTLALRWSVTGREAPVERFERATRRVERDAAVPADAPERTDTLSMSTGVGGIGGADVSVTADPRACARVSAVSSRPLNASIRRRPSASTEVIAARMSDAVCRLDSSKTSSKDAEGSLSVDATREALKDEGGFASRRMLPVERVVSREKCERWCGTWVEEPLRWAAVTWEEAIDAVSGCKDEVVAMDELLVFFFSRGQAVVEAFDVKERTLDVSL